MIEVGAYGCASRDRETPCFDQPDSSEVIVMVARSGRSICITVSCTCLLAGVLIGSLGCGSVQSGNDSSAAYKALPSANGIADPLAHRFYDMYEDEDMDIGLPPE